MATSPSDHAAPPPYRATARPAPRWVGARFRLPADAASGSLVPEVWAPTSYLALILSWFVLVFAGVDSLGLCAALAAVILLPLLACCVPTRLEAERDALSARWLFLRRRWHFADMLAADRCGAGLGEAGVVVRMRGGQALSLLTATRGNVWRNSAALWSSASNAHRLEALLNEAIAESGGALGRPAVAARVGPSPNATSVLPR